MADITVKKNDGDKPAPVRTPEPRWESLRALRDLMSWDPFREMSPFLAPVPQGFVPSFEVKETKDGYLFHADVPGVRESDLAVSVIGNRISVSGRREAEKREQNDTYYTYERSYGDFTRSFTLPEGVDMNSVRADLKDGVLTLSVRKTPEAQPKKITVQTSGSKA
jgi:HSP20 family protein